MIEPTTFRCQLAPYPARTHHLLPMGVDLTCAYCKRTEKQLRSELDAAPEYVKGHRDGVRYWTDRPGLIDMHPRRRATLLAQSPEYQRGFQDGADTVE